MEEQTHSSSQVSLHLSEAPTVSLPNRHGLLRVRTWGKLGLFAISLFLFILAITLMKEGARGLAPLVRDGFSVTNAANSLGFGWLFAYLVMSGSPVAAAALAFYDAEIIDQLSTFTMITGSRLGASFIVLFIGFLYVLRGRNRANSLSMGLLSLTVTGSTYLPALLVGVVLLFSGALDGVQLQSGMLLTSVTDAVFDPIAAFLLTWVPRWSLFLIGFGLILISFQLFDKCLPEFKLEDGQVGRLSRLVYRPWVMFVLGGLITLVSMSVSVSLGILVPLGERGFVRRENVIPYIMGANITTFIDTLLAAVLLQNPPAFTVVLAEVLSVTLVSLLILAFMYRPYERTMLSFTDHLTSSRRNLGFFMGVIFVVPLLLMFL